MAKSGRLIFKGGEPAVFAKKKKPKKKKRKHSKNEGEEALKLDSEQERMSPQNTAAEEEEEVQIESGAGRLTSSGIVVTGYETEFMNQLTAGDAIMVTHPTTFKEETRIVKMVLSNVSISISSPFSSDLVTTCPFHFIKAPKIEVPEEQKEQERKRKNDEEEKGAFGTYAPRNKVVYRVRNQFSYKIITEDADKSMSREELLDIRSKKKSDRMCAF
ncbi:unnamed protein product [Heterosigma akashiwo]